MLAIFSYFENKPHVYIPLEFCKYISRCNLSFGLVLPPGNLKNTLISQGIMPHTSLEIPT